VRPGALLIATAGIELATGLGLVLMPSLVTDLLIGEKSLAPATIVVGRVAGCALIAIGAICWLARKLDGTSRRTDVFAGLLIYNVAVPAVLGHAAVGYGLRGIALWPAVAVHTALAVWCLGCLKPPVRNRV